MKDYRQNYGDLMKEQTKMWFEKHPDYLKRYCREWRRSHPDYYRKRQRNHD